MSHVMEGIDARGYLMGWLHGVTDMFLKDIKAMPEPTLTKKFGGCARPANELVADTLGMLYWTTAALKGEKYELNEDSAAHLAPTLTTHTAIVEAMTKATSDFKNAFDQASDETLNKLVTPPWQMDAPLYILCQIAVSHIWYHDGQLNYIQALEGDEKVHWMD